MAANGYRNGRANGFKIAFSAAHIGIAFIAMLITNLGFIIGGVYTLTELQLAPLRTRVMTIEHDVERMGITADSLAAQLVTIRARAEANRQALAEIESQFCSVSDYANVVHANDLRVMAALWGKVMGMPFEISNAFYRQCDRPPLPP